jgi:hypothetical protein
MAGTTSSSVVRIGYPDPNCPQCCRRMRIFGVERDSRVPETNLHTFVCDRCCTVEVLLCPWLATMEMLPVIKELN